MVESSGRVNTPGANGWGPLEKRVPLGAEIGMEACASAHHWARELQRRGYRARLIAAQFVKPYVKSNKNDRVDAGTCPVAPIFHSPR